MKYYFLCLFIALFSIDGVAQKLHHHYSFYPQEVGNVYFIHPQKGFASNETGAKKDLTYDITYLSKADSATYTFTYFAKDVLSIDSIRLTDDSGNVIYTAAAVMYYVQPKKSYWQHRASVMIPYELLPKIYRNDTPYTLQLIGGRTLRYTMKPKTWKKQSYMVSRILEIVKYNH